MLIYTLLLFQIVEENMQVLCGVARHKRRQIGVLSYEVSHLSGADVHFAGESAEHNGVDARGIVVEERYFLLVGEVGGAAHAAHHAASSAERSGINRPSVVRNHLHARFVSEHLFYPLEARLERE